MLLFISMPSGGEWLFILLAVLLLFGGKKIPELMKGLGNGIREFNNARNNIKTQIEDSAKEPQKEPNKLNN